MHTDDLILISVDDHVIEPPDLFDAHLPDDLKDRAPKIVRRSDGSDVWRFGDVEVPNLALNASSRMKLPLVTISAELMVARLSLITKIGCLPESVSVPPSNT